MTPIQKLLEKIGTEKTTWHQYKKDWKILQQKNNMTPI
jgi:hypothetical protein